jgi:DNA mismatch repair protein MutS2
MGKSVVPLSITLELDNRILLISGPNAGGKSVTLKTVGLIQYMYQCGLLVPMAEYSTIGLFRNIFIDIGDEQSLENDLSTYSSHLTNMKHFLIQSDRKTLFLIDEFGTGTEPALGGAIAESILEDLNRSGAYGVINTHYTNLKTFADRTKGLVNGAMRYDAEHLEPFMSLKSENQGVLLPLRLLTKSVYLKM